MTYYIIIFCSVLQGFSFAIYKAGTRPCHLSNQILVHALINFAVGSLLWYFVGYSLSFGPSQKVRLSAKSFLLLFKQNDVHLLGLSRAFVMIYLFNCVYLLK